MSRETRRRRRGRDGPDGDEFLGIVVVGEEAGGEDKVAGVGKWSNMVGGEEVHAVHGVVMVKMKQTAA